jgi:hypothetical protein
MRTLGLILADVAQNISLSQEELDYLRGVLNNIEMNAAMTQGWIVADPTQISRASILAGSGNSLLDDQGLRIYNGATLTGWWQIDGTLRTGSNLALANTTSFAVFPNLTTYNGESMPIGTVLMGSNSSGFSNIRYDPSTGQLEFRGGTTVQAYVGTDGVIYWGGGNGKLDSYGLTLYAGTGVEASRSLNFLSGTTQLSYLTGIYDPSMHTNQVNLWALPVADCNSQIFINSYGPTGYRGFIALQAVAPNNFYTSATLISKADTNTLDFVISASSGTTRFSFDGAPVTAYHGFVGNSGATVDEFSIDGTFAGNSDTAVPTEKATETRIGAKIAATKLDDLAAPDNNTDLNATVSAHGLCPKGDDDATHFLNGDLGWTVPASGGGDKYPCEARLTLETGVPVSTTDQTAKTIVYLTPYNGDQVALYDGASAWTTLTLTEKHIDLTEAQTGTTTNGNKVISGLTDTSQLISGMLITGTGVGVASVIDTVDSATQVTGTVNSTASASVTVTFKVPASTVCDIFAFNSASAVKLELCKWTNTTTRATALAWQNGIYVKTGATTRRYMGTISTTTTAGQTEDSVTSAYVWNYYNRIGKHLFKSGGASHTYTTTSYRYWNNDTANALKFCIGVADSSMLVTGFAVLYGAINGYSGYCLDASNNQTNASISTVASEQLSQNTILGPRGAGSSYTPVITIGNHYIAMVEYGAASVTFNAQEIVAALNG